MGIQLLERDSITIIVTDSGLGGMSITADLVERLKFQGSFSRARVVFFNSSFDNHSGYNVISSHAEKINIFQRALESMTLIYQPDVILIGCNTLSVIYPDTPFAQQPSTRVVGIVETGVNQIMAAANEVDDPTIVIFATPTTIQKATYQQALIQHGVRADRIIAIPCGTLADEIEAGFNRNETKIFVQRCVDTAIEQISDRNVPLIVSLNCTHYGYVKSQFDNAFRQRGLKPKMVIDPNLRMVDFLFENSGRSTHPTQVDVDVVCKVFIFTEVMESIGSLIAPISPQTLTAMQHYVRIPELF
ncbi:aspartate/glutamate racemase family protein [candidate division KSB1 bacterium]|nr:aspartate/glutamate racemase family protein [candidate division KSB1 bacterium]